MDNYSKIRVVGRGAYGTAHLAKRLSDGKEVILKQIPVEQMSAADRQGALNEIKVLSMLQHPNIIDYHENFIQDKAMMIVMEYAAGGTLSEYIQTKAHQGTFIEEEEVAHLFAQIVLPMYYVHQNQVLHRDLKSENIFLTRSMDHVKIGDFGISKILSSKSKALTVVGTPCYISPELCEGKPYNTKSDVWALGCILFEMCACKRAFEAPTLPALIIRIMRGIISPLPSQYSAGVKQLLHAMLEVDPQKRPSVAEIMAHHWLAPYLYRIHTTVGGIPCSSKPQRPLSVIRPDSIDLPENIQPKFATRKRSPSQFQTKEPKSELYQLKDGKIPVQIPPKDPRSDITCISVSATHTVGVESSGAVLLWQDSQDERNGAELEQNSQPRHMEGNSQPRHMEGNSQPRHLEGMVGINIVQVATGAGFICFLTDRGIIMTKGSAESGCLGHGDKRNVNTPKIIEELLGFDVVQVEAYDDHVGIVTSDYEAFVWGTFGSKIKNLPVAVDTDLDIDKVICAHRSTILISKDGRMLAMGDNTNNRLFLDLDKPVEKSYQFKPVLDHVGDIKQIAVSKYCTLVLTGSGEIWSIGEDNSRAPTRINLDSKISQVMGLGATKQLHILVGQDGSVVRWTPGRWKERDTIVNKFKKKLTKADVAVYSRKIYILYVFE